MIKVTKHNAAIVRVLLKDKDTYRSAHQIALALDTQPQNLKTALARLVTANIVTVTETYPRLYSLNQPQALDFLNLIDASEGALMRRAV